MNLTQLKFFQAVCVYQTVSAAAAYLHVSQPTLSSAIKELESEFGLTLFRRQHSGMVLTEAGELLSKMSKDLLARAEEIETVMHDLGKENKKLRLGVPPMIGYLLMPSVYSGFLRENPDIRLEITEGGRQDLLKKLSDGFLDIVFATQPSLEQQISVAEGDASGNRMLCFKGEPHCGFKNDPRSRFGRIVSHPV